jgi:hypothetical protein
MLVRSVALLVVASVAYGQAGRRFCDVTLRVVDADGRSPEYSLKAFVDRAGHDYVGLFAGLRGRVPCSLDDYTFEVSRNGVTSRHGIIKGTVSVSNPENWLTVSTDPSVVFVGTLPGASTRMRPLGYVWEGRVEPILDEPVWVQIRSAFGAKHVEAETDKSGRFRMYRSFLKGPHLIYIISKDGRFLYCAGLQVESTEPTTPLIIDISSRAPPVMVVR